MTPGPDVTRGPDVTPGEPAGDPGAAVVLRELRALGRGDGIAAIRRLSGGSIADAWLITYADGAAVVGKTVTAGLPGVFAVEAAGLAALRGTGYLITPRVLAATSKLLLLEALAPCADGEQSWEGFARDLAAAHRSTAGNRFGWHHDGYLGRFRQVNTWTGDGHRFFAECRLLRYLSEPLADLSPSPPGWADRMPVLHLRELLSMIATFGPAATASIAQTRAILAPFYPRRRHHGTYGHQLPGD